MELHTVLQTLTTTPGPSGLEQDIAAVVAEMWRPYADTVETDRLGNLIALKDGAGERPRPRVLLAAHMDEIALMVTEVAEAFGNGYLRITNIGGPDRRQMLGQRVTVHGRQNVRGVIGALPSRLLAAERRNNAHAYEDLIVDVGLSIDQARALIDPGDFITFHQPIHTLQNDRVAGKALDNRLSIAAVTVALEILRERRHEWDVLAVATVQEETRLLGAHTVAFAQQPDVAIALDVAFAKGPNQGNRDTVDFNDGPGLDIGVNTHPGVEAALQAAADALELKVHRLPHAHGSGTDAYGLQIARMGVPTGIISIPIRYMHTVVETVALQDVERAGRWLAEFICRLEPDFVSRIMDEMMA